MRTNSDLQAVLLSQISVADSSQGKGEQINVVRGGLVGWLGFAGGAGRVFVSTGWSRSHVWGHISAGALAQMLRSGTTVPQALVWLQFRNLVLNKALYIIGNNL